MVYGGRARTVTQVIARWRTPVPWWQQATLAARAEREHFRLVTDGGAICELAHDGGVWYLERIVD